MAFRTGETMRIYKIIITSLLCSSLALTITPALAQENRAVTRQTVELDIQPQPMGDALNAFAQQSGLQVVLYSAITGDMQSRQLAGTFNNEREALDHLLNDTGLTYKYINNRTVAITARTGEDGKVGKSQPASNKLLAAQAGTSAQKAGTTTVLKERNDANQESEGLIEEITVTAQKREQSLQDVPMSITALTSDDIDKRTLAGMGDYLNTLPGITMHDRGAGRNAIVFRGISIDPQTEGFGSGPTVGVFLGDVPISGVGQRGATDLKLVDIERIEVLRGPQGTLYGASSLGGAVRNIPNSPNLSDFEGKVAVRYALTDKADSDDTMVQGVLNIPLVEDQLALRVVGYRYENGGVVDNIAGDSSASTALATANGVGGAAFNNKDVDRSQYEGGRLIALWEPTEDMSFQITYLTQDLEQDGYPEVQLNLPGEYQQARLDISDTVPGGESLTSDIEIANIEFKYDFPLLSFYSSTFWGEENSEAGLDISSAFSSGSLAGLFIPQLNTLNTETFTQELRLTSKLEGPLQFILGYYYEDVERIRQQDTIYGGAPALNPFGQSLLLGSGGVTTVTQNAFFGELIYSMFDKFELAVGGRWFDYDQEQSTIRTGAFSSSATPSIVDANEDDFILKVNLSYRPNEDMLFYAQRAEGFRTGRGTSPPPTAVCDANSDGIIDGTTITFEDASQVDSDTLENYEIGGKYAPTDGRFSINAAIFHIDWTGLPINVVSGCGFGVTDNVGSAQSRGVELEAALYLTDNLKINLAGSYVDAELETDGAGGMAGDRLPGSAQYNFNLGAQYDFTLSDYPVYARLDYSYVGDYFNNFQEQGIRLGDYHLLNLRAGISIDNLDFELFVRNLNNSSKLTWADSTFTNDMRAIALRPRAIGFDVRYQF